MIAPLRKLSKRNKNFVRLTNPKKLTFSYIKKINPKYIFFPDWSWMVPRDIVNNFQCVCIHESDLPKFRGGSPIQNQIIRGIKKTKSTAFLMTEGLDKGDILLQKNLSLNGIRELWSQQFRWQCQVFVVMQRQFFRCARSRRLSGKLCKAFPTKRSSSNRVNRPIFGGSSRN